MVVVVNVVVVDVVAVVVPVVVLGSTICKLHTDI